MKLSDLRTRVVIAEKTTASDGIGGRTVSWAERQQAWAKLETLSSGEVYRLQSVRVTASHKFTFRSEVVVEPSDRLEVGSRVFTIVGTPVVDCEGKASWLTVTAMEGIPS